MEAVLPFPTVSSVAIDPFRFSLCGRAGERATALVRLDRRPISETDVVEARGEIVTRVELAFSRWELHKRHNDILVAEADMPPVVVRPFAPFPCVVRLFGSGIPARVARRER